MATRRYIEGLNRIEIDQPEPEDVVPGMMCRPGIVVAEVDGEQALVGYYVGGTMERWIWTPIAELEVVWQPFVSFEAAMETIRAFNGVVAAACGLSAKKVLD